MTRPPSFPPSSVLPEVEEETALTTLRPPRPRVNARVSDQLTDRLSERRRARRRLRVRALVAAAVTVVLLAAGGWLALLSPVLALQTEDVAVVGTNEIVPEDGVMALVAAHEGEPLLRLDTRGLRQALLGLTGVLDVTVERDFPNGLSITITPREPVAMVEQDGALVLLDAEGVSLGTREEPLDGVPAVEVPVGSSETAPALTAVLAALDAVADAGLLERVEQAAATSAYEVELTLDDGASVVWGSAEDSALKAAVLARLLDVDAEVYDVSAPLSPITR